MICKDCINLIEYEIKYEGEIYIRKNMLSIKDIPNCIEETGVICKYGLLEKYSILECSLYKKKK